MSACSAVPPPSIRHTRGTSVAYNYSCSLQAQVGQFVIKTLLGRCQKTRHTYCCIWSFVAQTHCFVMLCSVFKTHLPGSRCFGAWQNVQKQRVEFRCSNGRNAGRQKWQSCHQIQQRSCRKLMLVVSGLLNEQRVKPSSGSKKHGVRCQISTRSFHRFHAVLYKSRGCLSG